MFLRSRNNLNGFTIFEIIITLTLLSIIGVVAANVIGVVTKRSELTQKQINQENLQKLLDWFQVKYSFELAQSTTGELPIALQTTTNPTIRIPVISNVSATSTSTLCSQQNPGEVGNVLSLIIDDYADAIRIGEPAKQKLRRNFKGHTWCLGLSDIVTLSYKGVTLNTRNLAASSGNAKSTSNPPQFDANATAQRISEHSVVSTDGIFAFTAEIDQLLDKVEEISQSMQEYSKIRQSSLLSQGYLYPFSSPGVISSCYASDSDYSCIDDAGIPEAGIEFNFDSGSTLGPSCNRTQSEQLHVPTDDDWNALGITISDYTPLWPITIRIANSHTDGEYGYYSDVEQYLRQPCPHDDFVNNNTPPYNAIIFAQLPSANNTPAYYYRFAIALTQ